MKKAMLNPVTVFAPRQCCSGNVIQGRTRLLLRSLDNCVELLPTPRMQHMYWGGYPFSQSLYFCPSQVVILSQMWASQPSNLISWGKFNSPVKGLVLLQSLQLLCGIAIFQRLLPTTLPLLFELVLARQVSIFPFFFFFFLVADRNWGRVEDFSKPKRWITG